jgi:spore germination protein KC
MKAIKLVCAGLLLLSLTGCWSKLELDEVSFVYGMFVDKGDEPGTIKLTISTILPNRLTSGQDGAGESSSGKMYASITKTADTLTGAMRAIQKDLTRMLRLSQIKVIVIGKTYATDGIDELLEWMRREPYLPLGTYIMAAPREAEELKTLTPLFEQMPSEVLHQFGEMNFVLDTTVKHCEIAEATGLGLAMNYLSFGKEMEENGDKQPRKWAAPQGALLFQNNRMTGKLGLKETLTLGWALNHISLPEYSMQWDGGKTKASVVFVRTKSAISVRMKGKKPLFTVKLSGRASVVSKHDDQNRDDLTFGRELLERLKERISGDMEQVLTETRLAGTDVLKLGSLLEWNYPKTWQSLRKDWSNYYRDEIAIIVDTDFRIADYGSEQ